MSIDTRIQTYDILVNQRTSSVGDRMQSSRIITSINIEGELKGNCIFSSLSLVSFDPRSKVPAFEQPSGFPLSILLIDQKQKRRNVSAYLIRRGYVSLHTTERTRNIRQT